ncbi:glycosyltransferase family 4 protein [Marinagarivorans algicola]|uniref:glycosyltransferase family 4 protein n=1 Tax=Marinagarivorans algicola TaxID=1513270 RepID=UPI0006B658F0|nr:glycosyltransferase family 4 protein [Marinagarivorans algicola]
MKIGFISVETPFDRGNFSGTLFYMYQALSEEPDTLITAIGHPKKVNALQQKISRKSLSMLKAIAPNIHAKVLSSIKKRYSLTVQNVIDTTTFDLLIAPVNSGVVATLTLHNQKLIFVTDATPAYIAQEYQQQPNQGMYDKEMRCIQKSFKTLYSSAFMASKARTEFSSIHDINDKIDVVRFGLNLDSPPKTITPKAPPSPVKLVFIGKEWERKGGIIAVEAAQTLQRQGIACQLTIIGCTPPITLDSALCTVIPFLDKNKPAQQAQYHDLLSQAHFLLLPTRADCTPMVIAEANAFSCPALASDVGGIPSLISNNDNGFLLPRDATGDDYAQKIITFINDAKRYKGLSERSFSFYQHNLTWSAWAKHVLHTATAV